MGIKLVIEGQEEVGSALNTYPQSNPEVFHSDAMVIADMGSVRPGSPTLTVALRGTAMATIELTTLAGPKHSGQYGGAAPDALIVLLHALASLHDENGDVAVEGLRREEWTGASYSEDEFRELAEVLPGLPLMGTGDLGSRIWSGPAITITGIDVPSVDNALNAVSPYARAKINMRVHPAQDALEAQAALDPPPRERAAVRDRSGGARGRHRQRLRGGDLRARLRGGARGAGDGLGKPARRARRAADRSRS